MNKITYDFMKNDTEKQGTETKKKMSKTVANAALNLVAAPVGKTLELVKKGADQTVNTGLAIGRKAVNATTGISLAEHLRQKLNIVLDANGAEYVHEVKITGIVVDNKLYKLDNKKFTLNDTLGAAKKLAELIKKDVWTDFKDTTITTAAVKKDSKGNVLGASPKNIVEEGVKEGVEEGVTSKQAVGSVTDDILKEFLNKSNTLLVSIVKK